MKDPYSVLKTVRVTEKSTMLTETINQYQMVVDQRVEVTRSDGSGVTGGLQLAGGSLVPTGTEMHGGL